MFTGIIEEIGKIKSVKRGSKSVVLEVEARKVLADTRIGDSIATNGVCLTVVGKGNDGFSADVMPETMNRSNLGLLKPGDPESRAGLVSEQPFGWSFGSRACRRYRKDREQTTG